MTSSDTSSRTSFERAATAEGYDRFKDSPTMRQVFIDGAMWARSATSRPSVKRPLSLRDTLARAMYEADPAVPQSATGWRHPWGNLPAGTQATYRAMADAAVAARDRVPGM